MPGRFLFGGSGEVDFDCRKEQGNSSPGLHLVLSCSGPESGEKGWEGKGQRLWRGRPGSPPFSTKATRVGERLVPSLLNETKEKASRDGSHKGPTFCQKMAEFLAFPAQQNPYLGFREHSTQTKQGRL